MTDPPIPCNTIHKLQEHLVLRFLHLRILKCTSLLLNFTMLRCMHCILRDGFTSTTSSPSWHRLSSPFRVDSWYGHAPSA